MVLQQLKALHAKDLFNEMICLVLEIVESISHNHPPTSDGGYKL